MSYQQPKIDQTTVHKIAEFLFGKAEKETDSQFLDRRTDVTGKHVFAALSYYRVLQERFNCATAGAIADIIERLSISSGRKGRLEGVQTLMQQFPRTETLLQGISDLLIKEKMAEKAE
jgi:hypothetical protein